MTGESTIAPNAGTSGMVRGSLVGFLAVARNTFLEAIRQPIYAILLLLVSFLLTINLFFSTFTLEDDNVLLVELGLSTLLLGGLALSAFTATGVLTREIEKRTVLTVVSKPIGRPTFFLAKFAGILLSLLVAEWIWTLVFLLTVRHGVLTRATDLIDTPVIFFGLAGLGASLILATWANYKRRKVFASSLTAHLAIVLPMFVASAYSFDKHWHVQSPTTDLRGDVLLAVFMLTEAVVILAAVAVAASARLRQVATLTVSLVVLFLGLSSDYFFMPHLDDSPLARVLYALLPNLQFLWTATALSQGNSVSAEYVAVTTSYALLYTTAVLGLGVALFQTREVG